MAVSGVSGASSPSSSDQVQSTNALADLQDQFMTILLAQLQNQDPMSPMQETEFFGQMAQFTTANQVSGLSDTMTGMSTKMDDIMALLGQNQYAQNVLSMANLVGQRFTAEVDGEEFEGVIDSVSFKGTSIMLKSGDTEIPLTDVTGFGGTVDAG